MVRCVARGANRSRCVAMLLLSACVAAVAGCTGADYGANVSSGPAPDLDEVTADNLGEPEPEGLRDAPRQVREAADSGADDEGAVGMDRDAGEALPMATLGGAASGAGSAEQPDLPDEPLSFGRLSEPEVALEPLRGSARTYLSAADRALRRLRGELEDQNYAEAAKAAYVAAGALRQVRPELSSRRRALVDEALKVLDDEITPGMKDEVDQLIVRIGAVLRGTEA